MWFFRSYWQNSQRFLLESVRPLNRSERRAVTIQFEQKQILSDQKLSFEIITTQFEQKQISSDQNLFFRNNLH